MRRILAVVLLAMALPATASAHNVSTNIECGKVTFTVTDSNQETRFTGELLLNGEQVAQWNVAGDIGTFDVEYTAPTGPFILTVNWQFSTQESGTLSKSLLCSETPPPPVEDQPAVPVDQAPTSTPAATPPVTITVTNGPKPKSPITHKRFGTPGKHTKVCVYGRRQLKDRHGRKFTVCKSKPKLVTRTPKFTG